MKSGWLVKVVQENYVSRSWRLFVSGSNFMNDWLL